MEKTQINLNSLKYLLTSIFSLSFIFSFGQTQKDSIKFSIAFSSCFDNDLTDLSINGVKVFYKVKITTAGIDGISNVSVYQDDKCLHLIIDKKETLLSKILIGDTLNCDILFNRNLEKFKLDLKNGENIFIDNCRPIGTIVSLNVRQFKGIVYLD